ncbi:MAG: DUF3786 domain-containing protein [Proteobacteria bacterium]|nr:DUF3786 domain-containing protein [Pseudomonadota bacterium]MBU1737522.1 DUF3786 domain-containing protein [Pseudomonadota bacterium]
MSEVKSLTGHEHSWRLFLELDPEESCIGAGASFDKETGVCMLRSFGQDIIISLQERRIFGKSSIADYLLNRTGHFFDLALLKYLILAQDMTSAGELIRPSEVKGGQIFVTGTHVLPVERIALKFGADPAGFIERGKLLGGEVSEYGDAAVKLFPFPKMPVTLILWVDDEEFPARVDFFFHKGCVDLFPTDVLWSMAMVTVMAMEQQIQTVLVSP